MIFTVSLLFNFRDAPEINFDFSGSPQPIQFNKGFVHPDFNMQYKQENNGDHNNTNTQSEKEITIPAICCFPPVQSKTEQSQRKPT